MNAGADVEFEKDMLHVDLDRRFGDCVFSGNFLVAGTTRDATSAAFFQSARHRTWR
jgi:hypothetical protein